MGNALMDIMTRIPDDEVLHTLGLQKGQMHLVGIQTLREAKELTKNMPRRAMAGGSAANTIRGIARLGIAAGFIGKVGRDRQAQMVKESLLEAGITPLLRESRARTGHAVALVTPDLERTFATFLGAAGTLNTKDLDAQAFIGYDLFHLEGYIVQNHTLLERAIELAKNAHQRVSLDFANYTTIDENREFLHRVLPDRVDIVFANQEEARAFTGKPPREALEVLATVCEIAVVKLGAEGAMAMRGKEFAIAPALSVECVDTTGCGDMFTAGFLYALLNEWSLEECLKFGCFMASHIIQTVGARMPEEHWHQIEDHLERRRG